MATSEVVPAAPAAVAPSPAPVSAPVSSSAPVSTPAAPAVSEATPASSSPTTRVDANKFSSREDYATALLAEKMAELETPAEEAKPAEGEVKPVEVEVKPTETAEVTDKPAEEQAAPAQDEELFQLEPEAIVTPETLATMVKDNAEFAKILESDPKLKGQLYKTAREAAELKPYREIFPDIDSAKAAQQSTATWNDMRNAFLGSTTRDGAIGALNKIAELSYERDANGQPILDANGEPVIGDDFYGFFEHVEAVSLENRAADVDARLQANRYATQDERDNDERLKAAIDILREADAASGTEDLPEALRKRAEDLDRRERELTGKQQTEKVQARQTFEQGLQAEAQKRIGDSITRIIANVEKQGGAISPYLKNILPRVIASKLVAKIQANPTLQGQMQELQRLPIGDDSRTRRLAAIDRAIQSYLPDVAREELREAGVQVKAASDAKRAKIETQAEATRKSETKGSTAPVSAQTGGITADQAYRQAEAEWKTANPGKPITPDIRIKVVGRVLQLMSQ
jgi:hypothetical protein